MSNVWFAIPSARPADEAEKALSVWRRMGYKIALLRQGEDLEADILVQTSEYRGWAPSVNALARSILIMDREAEWIVTGGDDTLPDPNHTPAEIARECCKHFINRMVEVASAGCDRARLPQHLRISGEKLSSIGPVGKIPGATFGVMQPTGDTWSDSKGRIIDRFAGSPWLGRAWCERAYGGNGPMHPYFHNWADEELQNVAIKLGVFWQRPDLTHMHNHYARQTKSMAQWAAKMPAFAGIISQDYRDGKPLFESRKAAGWPGSDPL